MRKLLPFVLAFVFVVVLVACGENDSTQTTLNPFLTSSQSPSDSTSQTGVSNPSSENVAQTYVLTTAADMTMPTVLTTQFVAANEAVSDPYSTQPVTTDFNFTIPASTTVPVVVTVSIPTVVTTDASSSGGTTKEDESKTTTKNADTTKNNAKAFAIEANDISTSGEKVICAVQLSDYGPFKSNSTYVTVKVDGTSYDNIPCKLTSKITADNCQEVTFDLSSISSLDSGSEVSFTIPSGLVVSKDGKYYNRAYSNTAQF